MAKKKETLWIGKNHAPKAEEAGFVYQITNCLTGKRYIGKKFFWSIRRHKVKGKKRRRVERKESDWKYYKSSSKRVQKEIQLYKEECFVFEILERYKTRGEVNYNETRLLFVNDVLNNPNFLNDNIMNRYFRKNRVT